MADIQRAIYNVELNTRLIGKRQKDGRTYNLPTAFEVVALIVGDIGDTTEKRDIILCNNRNFRVTNSFVKNEHLGEIKAMGCVCLCEDLGRDIEEERRLLVGHFESIGSISMRSCKNRNKSLIHRFEACNMSLEPYQCPLRTVCFDEELIQTASVWERFNVFGRLAVCRAPEHQTGRLQQISELHLSYLPLQYPLLFPYGEDGYRVDIPHKGITSSRNSKRPNVTMREFFAFILQDWVNIFSLILNARRLL
ncbi:hypothetical protein OSB04_016747 [Centaurea solstitialis]|uniref:Uncharacterized protein n=1 Tax=Centaurea solstitialis TaxID=347529 RepID=A0AA38TJQ2_9ASTR|nr:hypothetical protein OSB04_016747 [Centaurea solstitialis]